MTSFYDEVEIEDMTYDDVTETFHYPCPCGDKFHITKQEILDGDEIARCPSCSLIIRVIYDKDNLDLK
ncbi:Diphthamide biosynthesis protein 3 [Blyttiomyces sp. JEL0837]|nr:Diphthamide biosynthesis protein 3 [Blyttiomyces sp. JEL0837]